MPAESDPELQTLLSAAFIRLSQESASRRYYDAMQQVLDSVADLYKTTPQLGGELPFFRGPASRIALPEFIEEALAAQKCRPTD